MSSELSFDLHVLTARLDRAADRILQQENGVSYRRFLALLTVGRLGATTQRALAEELGVSEPSVSRMTAVLVDAGLLLAGSAPGGGNRRRLGLTPAGADLVARSRELLERRFADLVARSGVSYGRYARDTRSLVEALDAAPDRATA